MAIEWRKIVNSFILKGHFVKGEINNLSYIFLIVVCIIDKILIPQKHNPEDDRLKIIGFCISSAHWDLLFVNYIPTQLIYKLIR